MSSVCRAERREELATLSIFPANQVLTNASESVRINRVVAEQLGRYTTEQLLVLNKCAVDLSACERKYTEDLSSVINDVLAGGKCIRDQRYPKIPGKSEAIDNGSSAAFFHAHRGTEVGHFHLFQTLNDQIYHPKIAVSAHQSSTSNHLGITEMDENGRPFRLSSVNQCITGDDWFPSEEVPSIVAQFSVRGASSYYENASEWLDAFVGCFAPQFIFINQAREEAMCQEMRLHGKSCLQDRSREVLSSAPVDFPLQQMLIASELNRRDIDSGRSSVSSSDESSLNSPD